MPKSHIYSFMLGAAVLYAVPAAAQQQEIARLRTDLTPCFTVEWTNNGIFGTPSPTGRTAPQDLQTRVLWTPSDGVDAATAAHQCASEALAIGAIAAALTSGGAAPAAFTDYFFACLEREVGRGISGSLEIQVESVCHWGDPGSGSSAAAPAARRVSVVQLRGGPSAILVRWGPPGTDDGWNRLIRLRTAEGKPAGADIATDILRRDPIRNANHLVSGDFNGNKTPDFIGLWDEGQTRLYLWQSDDTLAEVSSRIGEKGINGTGASVLVGDYNGDGRDDLLVVWSWPGHSEDGMNRLFYGREDGGFSMGPTNAIGPGGINGAPSFLLAADFTGDGWADVMAHWNVPGHDEDGQLRLWRSTGTGFGPAEYPLVSEVGGKRTYPATNGVPRAVVTGDFNGDGGPDLFFLWNDGTNRIFLNQGDGHFGSAVPQPIPPRWVNEEPDTVVSGDWNGDGFGDILFIWPGSSARPDGFNRIAFGGPQANFVRAADNPFPPNALNP